MAPEYFDDFSEIDFSSDIYSFGILFYKILTGHSLFEGKTVLETIKMKLDHFQLKRDRFSKINKNLSKLINKCMLEK